MLGSILIKNSSSIVIAILYYALTYVYLSVIASHLGPSSFGDFSVALAIAGQGWILALLGSNMAVYKILPGYIERSDYSHVKGYIYRVFCWAIVTSITLSVILSCAYVLAKLIIHDTHPAIYASVIIPLMALSFLTNRILLASKVTLSTQSLSQVFLPLCILILLELYLRYYPPLHALSAIIIVAISYAVLLILLGFILFFSIFEKIRKTKAKYKTKEWLFNSLKFLPLSMSWVALYTITIVILEIFGPNEIDVGLYAAAYRISIIMIMIQVNLYALFLPKISSEMKAENYQNVKLVLRKLFKINVLVSISTLLIMLVFGKMLLHIYGSHFVKGYFILCIFVVAESIYIIFAISSYLLQFAALGRVNIFSQVFMMFFSIILALVLTPYFSMLGAVLSFTIPLLTISFFQTWIIWRKKNLLFCG